jgi:hypothetical protein
MKNILLTLDEDQIATLQLDFKHKTAGYKARIKVLTQSADDHTDETIRMQHNLIVYHYLHEQFKRAAQSPFSIS